jgi:hypothetical protein
MQKRAVWVAASCVIVPAGVNCSDDGAIIAGKRQRENRQLRMRLLTHPV